MWIAHFWVQLTECNVFSEGKPVKKNPKKLDFAGVYSPLLLPVCRREQVCLLQLEQKTGSVWQICHSLSVFLTSLLLTVTITSQCFTDFLYFVIFFLLSPLSFTTFFPASQQLTLYLCHLTTLPRLPSLQSPLFLLLPSCYWQLSHSISDATVSNHLSFPPFTQSYTFSPPHPPLPYPWYWQLSWSTDLASFFFSCDNLAYFGLAAFDWFPQQNCHPVWWFIQWARWDSLCLLFLVHSALLFLFFSYFLPLLFSRV